MNKRVKGLLAVTCCIVLVVASILGTVAYMTDRSDVTNTFTVGDVDIKLDEAKVDEYGEPQGTERTEEENNYKLIPGMTYTKDPTVTVLKGSEESYVRMIVTITKADALKAIFGSDFLPQNYVEGWDGATWTSHSFTEKDGSFICEFRYKTTVTTVAAETDLGLSPLFTSIKVPGEITGEQLDTLKDMEIKVEAHAIQAATFTDADAAWAAFDTQVSG